LRAGDKSVLRSALRAVARTWPLLTVIAAMVIWRSNGQGAETSGWFTIYRKVNAIFFTLRDQSKLLDIVSLTAAIYLIYFGIRDKRGKIDMRFGTAALLFAGALLIIPYQLFGSALADSRIYPFLFIAAILSVHVRDEAVGPRVINIVTLSFAMLFMVRIAASSLGYAEYDAAYKRHLVALDHIEPGASVAVLVGYPCDTKWRLARVEHLGSMALLRRDAFINSEWDVPGAELLRAKHADGTNFNVDPSQFVLDPNCGSDLRPFLAKKIQDIPQGYFDYVWVFNFDKNSLPKYKSLSPIYYDESTILYRIDNTKSSS
jgi:hypothetical protein